MRFGIKRLLTLTAGHYATIIHAKSILPPAKDKRKLLYEMDVKISKNYF